MSSLISEQRPALRRLVMAFALRPATSKLLLIAASVLFGLLAIALLVASHLFGSHGAFIDAATTHYIGELHSLGVLWH